MSDLNNGLLGQSNVFTADDFDYPLTLGGHQGTVTTSYNNPVYAGENEEDENNPIAKGEADYKARFSGENTVLTGDDEDVVSNGQNAYEATFLGDNSYGSGVSDYEAAFQGESVDDTTEYAKRFEGDSPYVNEDGTSDWEESFQGDSPYTEDKDYELTFTQGHGQTFGDDSENSDGNLGDIASGGTVWEDNLNEDTADEDTLATLEYNKNIQSDINSSYLDEVSEEDDGTSSTDANLNQGSTDASISENEITGDGTTKGGLLDFLKDNKSEGLTEEEMPYMGGEDGQGELELADIESLHPNNFPEISMGLAGFYNPNLRG